MNKTKKPADRLIFHVDVNSAFLSWESARRMKEGLPDLRDIPACIGGDPAKRTGIVVAKSIPAKKCGVQTGEPVAMALRKCPNMVIVPSDFDLYVKCSRAFKKICASYTPVMESFSIDEVFLDMTGTSLLYPDPIAAAHEIKDRISDELGFTVNVGISTNKLLAKMASDFEKPNKVHTLFPEEIPAKMWPLPVRELLFLGKASEKKGFSAETTFNEDIVSIEQVDPILLAQCDIVAARMRRKKKKCTSVSITFRTLDFRNRSHQTKLPNATDITDEIYRCAKQLFRESWKGEPLRLIGVSVTGLTEDDFEQLSLFEDPEKKEKSRKLDAALDAIRQKYGNDKVTRASILNGAQGIARKAKAQMKNDAEN